LKQDYSHKSPLKVVLFGPQNSGKTTFAELLAHHYDTNFSKEYARQFSLKHKNLNYQTVLPIAKGQLQLEKYLVKNASSNVVFMDTNLLETLVYSKLYYSKIPDELTHLVSQQFYDLYLLCDVDISWKNDGVRDLSENRNEHYDLFKSYLVNYNANFIELKGSKAEKLVLAKEKINQLLVNGF